MNSKFINLHLYGNVKFIKLFSFSGLSYKTLQVQNYGRIF